ncbi:MAG: hypothetical protein LC099_04840 [Anaerolineales bacterium]|nr:hypothetical protein [Anaerolineales bacterium]
MNFLLDPNVAYLFLLGAVTLTFFAIVTPGTGLLEVGAVFCFLLTGYAVYNLPMNGLAAVLIALSVAPFLYAVQKPRREWALATSIFLLVFGSIFLFAADGWKPAVNPLLAAAASITVSVSLWMIIRKLIQASAKRPTHDLETIVGQTGEARTSIHREGSAYINGELWSARSESKIHAGSQIRVVARDGFILVVESVK